MGIFRNLGKLAAREGAYIFGLAQLKQGADVIRRTLLRSHRRCPKCASGRMFRFSEVVDGVSKEFYGCSHCDHFEPLDVERDPEALHDLQDLARHRLEEMTAEQRANAERTYRWRSRGSLAISLVFLVGGFWVLLSGIGVAISLNLGAMAALFFVQGLRASYRYWQLETGMLYQPDAFKLWMASGKWLV